MIAAIIIKIPVDLSDCSYVHCIVYHVPARRQMARDKGDWSTNEPLVNLLDKDNTSSAGL